MDESDEIEMMFLKGHASPPDVLSDEDAIDACSEHCPLKAMLFNWISAVDNHESEEEKNKTLYPWWQRPLACCWRDY